MKPNGHLAALPDPIDAAIAAAEKPVVAMRQYNVQIASTGRPAAIALPADVTDAELAEVAGWMLTGLMGALRVERTKGPASRIVIPGRA